MIPTKSKESQNILITGGEGFIGSHLYDYIKENYPNNRLAVYDIKSGKDVLDKNTLRDEMSGADVVIHLAAEVSVSGSWKDPNKFYETNILGMQNVIEAAINEGVKKIVFASSSAVYDEKSSPYALSKSVNEKMLEMYSDKIQVVITRFFNVYGMGQNREYAAVIPAFYESIVNKGYVDIYGDGKQTRDFTYIKDLVRGIYFAAAMPLKNNFNVYELGVGESTSVNKLAKMLFELLGTTPDIRYLPERKEVKHSKANPEKAEKELNFRAVYKIDSGLKDYVKEINKFRVKLP